MGKDNNLKSCQEILHEDISNNKEQTLAALTLSAKPQQRDSSFQEAGRDNGIQSTLASAAAVSTYAHWRVQIGHGQFGAGPDGAVYATPSLWLASHPAYNFLLKKTK